MEKCSDVKYAITLHLLKLNFNYTTKPNIIDKTSTLVHNVNIKQTNRTI